MAQKPQKFPQPSRVEPPPGVNANQAAISLMVCFSNIIASLYLNILLGNGRIIPK
jgi:hypothetical protein